MKDKNLIERENQDLRAKYKGKNFENEGFEKKKRMYEEQIERLDTDNSKLRKYESDYIPLRKQHDELIVEHDGVNNRLYSKEDELNRVKNQAEKDNVNYQENYKINQQEHEGNLNVLRVENEELRQRLNQKDGLDNENADLRNQLNRQIQENDLSKRKLDEQYLELQKTQGLRKENNDLHKRIDILEIENEELRKKISHLDSEIEKKNRIINEDNNKIRNLNEKAVERDNKIVNQKERIEILEEELRQRKKNKNFRVIDFKEDDFSEHGLILTQKNWPICEPWLTPMRNSNNGNLKMNLLYKATRDGFSGLNFNEKCNGKKNTFVVVKNEHDKVFGGFTPLN